VIARRSILLAGLAASGLRADERTDALDLVAPLAAALADEDRNAPGWNAPKNLPNREELAGNVAALIAQAVTTSSVEVISVDSGSAELDWYMQIRNRSTRMLAEQRRGTVRIAWSKKRLTRLEPASFFAPPKAP
jgi:hypothetical protein